MTKITFPWIALVLGVMAATLLLFSGAVNETSDHKLPLLTLLIVNEFAFFVTAIGAGLGVTAMMQTGFAIREFMVILICGILAGGFLWLAIKLWPGMASTLAT